MEENKKPSLIEKMKQNEIDEASGFITEVYNTVTKDETVRVPEPLFRELFLPAFIDNDSAAAQSARENWMGIVGSHTNGADVVDMKGDVVFHVPPLFNTEALNINPTKRTLREAFSEYSEDAPIHQQSAIGKLMLGMDSALTGLYGNGSLEKVRAHDIEEWKKIFSYYGVIEGSTPGIATSKIAGNTVEDDFE